MTQQIQVYKNIVIIVGPKIGMNVYIILEDKALIAKISNIAQKNLNINLFFKSKSQLKNLILEEKISPSWILNFWGNEIISPDILNQCRNSLNIHPSLLPWGKGRDPVFWNVLNGEPAGATLHSMTELLDDGPIYVQREIQYDLTMTSELIYTLVLKTCLDIFREYWPLIYNGDITPKPQRKLNSKNRTRHELHTAKVIKLEKNNESEILKFIRWINACDFGANYSAGQIQISGELYEIRMIVKKVKL